ncbi:hypothetical protein TcasGA2_TC003882 [Tribolium castaneum]|uniref:Uncharacterized protein n=1 Tax=Tribolium castaneum TaxID=7070 RepID=D6WH52_TRICA|nr:hypothetical protein TcasGA2_TC003882 [Tribolium castaneum]
MQNTQEECGYGGDGEGRSKAAASPTDHKQQQQQQRYIIDSPVRDPRGIDFKTTLHDLISFCFGDKYLVGEKRKIDERGLLKDDAKRLIFIRDKVVANDWSNNKQTIKTDG